jgi:hypothetical protein
VSEYNKLQAAKSDMFRPTSNKQQQQTTPRTFRTTIYGRFNLGAADRHVVQF